MQVTDSISIAANTVNPNILETLGLRIRTLPITSGPVVLQLLSTGSALGLEHAFFVGADNPYENSIVNANNRVPIVPDDLTFDDILAAGGSQLQLQVGNTTAGALTYFFTLIAEEISV